MSSFCKLNKNSQQFLTYGAPQAWHIKEGHDGMICILITYRESEIITTETHKLDTMTNLYEG